MFCATVGSVKRNPSPKGERGRKARSPVSKVVTDCKAGVKFDLVGQKRRDGSEGHNSSSSFSSFGMRTDLCIVKYEGLSSHAKLLWNSPKGRY